MTEEMGGCGEEGEGKGTKNSGSCLFVSTTVLTVVVEYKVTASS